MTDINTFTFTGRLTSDPELQVTSKGTKLLKFSVANNTGYGEHEHANFFNCSVFGSYAESLSRFMEKGCEVTVNGEVNITSKQNNDGSTTRYTNINAKEVKVSKKASTSSRSGSGVTGNAYVPQVHTMDTPDDNVQIDEEDLPF